MKTNSLVSLVVDFGKVKAPECGRVITLKGDMAEVKFDNGIQQVVPIVNLDEFNDAVIAPTTEKEIVQGNGNPDPSARVDMLVALALDSDEIENERRAIEAKIVRLKAQLASLSSEAKELAKVAVKARSAAVRVSRMKLSDAAKIAEIKAVLTTACGGYAKKG